MGLYRLGITPLCGVLIVAVGGVGALAPTGVASAQDSQRRVDEVIVTTRKLEENLQDVPIAVSVVDSDYIQRAGVSDLRDLAQLEPSLSVNEFFSQNDTRITVRGLTNTRGRSNVAFLVDGIDVTSEPIGNSGSPLLVNQRLLNDIERVEIVKGPQSALYGRAAFAGAINYVTKVPGNEFEALATLDISDQDEYEVGGAVTLPISDDLLSMRINAVHWDADGYYPNEVTGKNLGGGKGDGLAATFMYTPAESVSIKARVSYSDDEYEQRATARLTEGATTLPVPFIEGVTDPDTFVDIIQKIGDADGLVVQASENPRTGQDYPGTSSEIFRTSVTADWDTDKWLFSSYTGITDADTHEFWDFDRQARGRPDMIFGHAEVNSLVNTKQFSQELRAASNFDGPVQFTLGGLYWTEERKQDDRSIISVCRVPSFCMADGFAGWQDLLLAVEAANAPDGYSSPARADTDSWSLYALMSWDINEKWTLLVENRLVNERFFRTREKGSSCTFNYPLKITSTDIELYADGNADLTCDNGPHEEGSIRSSFHTPKATLEYRPTADSLIYASVGKAQKPGGISGGGAPGPFAADFENLFFLPEKMWAYEIGSKNTWDGKYGALTLNGALFYQDYTDKQISIRTVVDGFLVGRTANASAASVAGLELATSWATPLDGLTIGAAYTYLDTKYDEFTDITTDERRIVAADGCIDVVDLAGTLNCVVDLSGNKLELAPEHALSGLVNLTRPLGGSGLEWYVESNVEYQDERFTTDNNEAKLDSYWRMDARVGLLSERWRATVYVDNVLDDNTLLNWGNSPDFGEAAVEPGFAFFFVQEIVALPQPRTVGLRLLVDF